MTRRNTWTDIDFRPAHPGWRVIAFNLSGGTYTTPIAGWLVQDSDNDQYDTSRRRVIPAIHDTESWTDEPVPVDRAFDDCLWLILGPGQADPNNEDAVNEWTRRVKHTAELADPAA